MESTLIRILDAGSDSEIVFTHTQLARAFDRVRDLRDWKGPIRAEIAARDRALVEVAVAQFTATIPVFDPLSGSPDRLVISAPGYRLGPWGTEPSTGWDLPRRATGLDQVSPAADLAACA